MRGELLLAAAAWVTIKESTALLLPLLLQPNHFKSAVEASVAHIGGTIPSDEDTAVGFRHAARSLKRAAQVVAVAVTRAKGDKMTCF